MRGLIHCRARQIQRRLTAHTYSSDQLPREGMFKQKFRLLTLFAAPPLTRVYGVPINLIEVGEVATVFKVVSAGVGQGERLAALIIMRPIDDFL